MRLTLIIVLACGALLLVGSAAAQEATPTEGNETAPDGAPDELEIVVDENVALVDYSYHDGELALRFYASDTSIVTVSQIPERSEEAGVFQRSRHRIRSDRTTVVRVQTTQGASFWTSDSIAEERAYFVRTPSESIIPAPYTGSDVMWAGVSGALGVAVAVLYGAVAAVLGGRREGGLIA